MDVVDYHKPVKFQQLMTQRHLHADTVLQEIEERKSLKIYWLGAIAKFSHALKRQTLQQQILLTLSKVSHVLQLFLLPAIGLATSPHEQQPIVSFYKYSTSESRLEPLPRPGLSWHTLMNEEETDIDKA